MSVPHLYNNIYPLALSVSTVELLRFGFPLHHRIHCLQVGRVGHERHCDVLVTDSVHPPVIHPQMVFDVTRSLDALVDKTIRIIIIFYHRQG